MDKICISVIVPLFNVGKYINDCLDSLERQTLKEIEVILVNDGSTDDSAEIARDYCNRNDKFILISRDNGGLSAARNTGLDVAHGEYVYFLDSDDYLADNALEKLYERVKLDDLDALRFSAYCFEDSSEEFTWQHNGGYKYTGDYPDVYSGIDFYKKAVDNDDYYPSCCLIIIRRECIEKNGLRFVEGIVHEDNLFYFEIAVFCKRIAVMNEPLYYRRFRSESITQMKAWINKNRSMCISAENADEFIELHPEIKGTIGNWQIRFFFYMMLNNWEQMTRKEQNSDESRGYFLRIKPLLKKYGLGESKSLQLFYVNYSLYRAYRRVMIAANKITRRS